MLCDGRFRRVRWLVLGVGLLLVGPVAPQPRLETEGRPPARPAPRPEPVAETKLLMAGINQPNFEGLDRLLRERPASARDWAFVRGQALLIAENGNLLLLRPPHRQGTEDWLERAAAQRTLGVRLARYAADRDYDKCRNGLRELAETCNRCHQTFRVSVRVNAFAEEPVTGGVPSAPAPTAPPRAPAPPPVPQPPE